ncbi:sensor domain-containing protein [Streptomyces violens]|uniref:sensor domain-containing protein n=1 Tax=Streptomyces violens TaxID=66377 RepID=UPI0004BE6CEE|nr:sensor domain-containing protein [Streptomyces violens]
MRIRSVRRRSVRRRAALTAAAAVLAATAVGATAAVAAPAATAPPRFLAPGELPPHASSPWYASKVTPGLPDPEPFCLDGGVVPGGAGTYHRSFHTEYDTGAVQVSVVTSSDDSAQRLAAKLRQKVARCAGDWLHDKPGGTASWKDYGTVTAADGGRVYGIHTSIPESEPGIHLFGVGRSGRTVTVVQWGEMGTFEHAPVPAFKATLRQALNKL